jgi:large conductance mechanosensitive channel
VRSVQRGRTAATEFRDFVLRGNMVELAVAFVMGAAFTNVVEAFVTGVLLPLIAAAGGKSDFTKLGWNLNEDNVIAYGLVLSALFSLLLAAVVLFFGVVKPMNALLRRFRTEAPGTPTTRPCPWCLSQIPVGASRCAFCTADVEPLARNGDS